MATTMGGRAATRTTPALLAALLLALLVPGIARAANVTVTTTADGTTCVVGQVCTLRGALQLSDPQNGTVVSVPAGTYTLNPQFGQITMAADQHTVIGTGARSVIIDGGTTPLAPGVGPIVVPN